MSHHFMQESVVGDHSSILDFGIFYFVCALEIIMIIK